MTKKDIKKDKTTSGQRDFEYLSRIDGEIQSVKSEIAELKESLKKKADQDKLSKLEKGVVILEKEVFNWRKLAQAKN